jgi:hypothetical protein
LRLAHLPFAFVIGSGTMAPRKGEAGIERASRLRATYTDLINKERFSRVCDILKCNPAELRDVEDGLVNKGLLDRFELTTPRKTNSEEELAEGSVATGQLALTDGATTGDSEPVVVKDIVGSYHVDILRLDCKPFNRNQSTYGDLAVTTYQAAFVGNGDAMGWGGGNEGHFWTCSKSK